MYRSISFRSGSYLAFAALIFACAAKAAIVSDPADIVDNGTYITDNNTGLQWYKFRTDQSVYGVFTDPTSTVGMKFSDVISPRSVFSQAGWKPATIDQVASLWLRFGWSGVKYRTGPNPNSDSGLTDAIGGFLGYTYGADYGYSGAFRDVIGLAVDTSAASGLVQAELITSDRDHDYIYLNNTINSPDYSWFGTGTYLVREVPLPGTLGLLSVGLVALGFLENGRVRQRARSV
jgi:hypothetical protein